MKAHYRLLINLLLSAAFFGVLALCLSAQNGTNHATYLLQIARQPVSEPLQTTSDAFVDPKGRAFRTDDVGRMWVFLGPTPSKFPPEALNIYARATAGLATRIAMRHNDGRVDLVVESLSPNGDFMIPCNDKEHCRRILLAVGLRLPLELQASHNG